MKKRRFDSRLKNKMKKFKLVLLKLEIVACASGHLKGTPTGPASYP